MTALRAIFAPKQFTGWHMFGVLCLFFGTIITVNLFLAYSAGTTWTGLVVKNTYVESQNFNARQNVIEKQIALGWQMDVAYADGTIALNLKDWSGQPINGAIVTAIIGRPVQEGEDHMVELNASDNGYSATDDLAPGIWRAQLNIIGPQGEAVQKTKRFVVGAAE